MMHLLLYTFKQEAQYCNSTSTSDLIRVIMIQVTHLQIPLKRLYTRIHRFIRKLRKLIQAIQERSHLTREHLQLFRKILRVKTILRHRRPPQMRRRLPSHPPPLPHMLAHQSRIDKVRDPFATLARDFSREEVCCIFLEKK